MPQVNMSWEELFSLPNTIASDSTIKAHIHHNMKDFKNWLGTCRHQCEIIGGEDFSVKVNYPSKFILKIRIDDLRDNDILEFSLERF